MARVVIGTENRAAEKLLAGTKTRPVNLTEVSRRTGIPRSSLYKKRNNPKSLSLIEAIAIAKAIHMTDDEWLALRKGD